MSKSRHAFTQIELVIVVLLLSILTATAAPKFLEAYTRQRVEAAAARIRADLELARKLAMTKSETRTVIFNSEANSYTLSDLEDLDRRADSYDVDLSKVPYEVKLTAEGIGVSEEVEFDFHGTPNRGGTVTISSDGYQQTVTLNGVTGKATVP